MTVILGILAFLVTVLAVLQGWQMFRKKNNSNPNTGVKLDKLDNQLDKLTITLNLVRQRLDDIWEEIKK